MTASMAEKTTVFAPMPSASVRMTAAERPGALRRKRKAARALARAASTRAEIWTSRSCWVICSRPPKSMRAWRRAASGDKAGGLVIAGEGVDVEGDLAVQSGIAIAFTTEIREPPHDALLTHCFEHQPYRL